MVQLTIDFEAAQVFKATSASRDRSDSPSCRSHEASDRTRSPHPRNPRNRKPRAPRLTTTRDWRAEAERWAQEHPDAWRLLRHKALHMARANSREGVRRRIGMKRVVEECRWEHRCSKHAGDFKFNNNYTSYLARMLIDKHPEMQDLIELRNVRC